MRPVYRALEALKLYMLGYAAWDCSRTPSLRPCLASLPLPRLLSSAFFYRSVLTQGCTAVRFLISM